MTRQAIIEKTVHIINQLPKEKAEEIFDFAEYMIIRYEESMLKGIQKLSAESRSFDFLNEDEDLYTVADLKKVYNG